MGHNNNLRVIKQIQQASGVPGLVPSLAFISALARFLGSLPGAPSFPREGRYQSGLNQRSKVSGVSELVTRLRGSCQSAHGDSAAARGKVRSDRPKHGSCYRRRRRRSKLLIIAKRGSHDSPALSTHHKSHLCVHMCRLYRSRRGIWNDGEPSFTTASSGALPAPQQRPRR